MSNAVLVLCGPSGVGKSTILGLLLKEFPDKFGFGVSHTTRSLRPLEVDGVHYHSISRDTMLSAVKNGKFVEHAEIHGNIYGTSFEALGKVHQDGKICAMDLDEVGVTSLKAAPHLDVKCLALVPPSLAILEQRLRDRKSESEEQIQIRLNRAIKDIKFCRTSQLIDELIINTNSWDNYPEIKRLVTKSWWPAEF